jgi:hypothetical protein
VFGLTFLFCRITGFIALRHWVPYLGTFCF